MVRDSRWRPYLAAHFGLFDIRTFLWSLSQVQGSTFYPLTPKVGSKCTYIILTSSSVKPSIVRSESTLGLEYYSGFRILLKAMSFYTQQLTSFYTCEYIYFMYVYRFLCVYICYLPAGRSVWRKTVTEGLKMLPEVAGRGHHFQAQGHSFSLCRPTLGPGRTGQIFVYFAKKSVTSCLRQVRPVNFRSTKFCLSLPNFKDAVVLPRSRTNFCQAWNRTDLFIYTPWFEGKC